MMIELDIIYLKQVFGSIAFLILMTGTVVLGTWITANIYRESVISADELTPSRRE